MVSINSFSLNVFFSVNCLVAYTDIIFPEDITITEVYDICAESGVLNQVMAAIPENELQTLQQYLDAMVGIYLGDNRSVVGGIRAIIKALESYIPEGMKAEDVIDMVKNIDLSNLTALKDIVSTLGLQDDIEKESE